MTTAIIIFLVAVIIGMVVSDKEETCPRALLGYQCRGKECDHRKSVLYRVKMEDAEREEKLEAHRNLWKGKQ